MRTKSKGPAPDGGDVPVNDLNTFACNWRQRKWHYLIPAALSALLGVGGFLLSRYFKDESSGSKVIDNTHKGYVYIYYRGGTPFEGEASNQVGNPRPVVKARLEVHPDWRPGVTMLHFQTVSVSGVVINAGEATLRARTDGEYESIFLEKTADELGVNV